MEYSIFERLLHEKGATVYQVSKATHIAASTFTDWKNGRSVPKADKLKKIADYFGISVDYLISGEIEEVTPTVLTNDEESVLALFRKIPEHKRALAFELLRFLGD